MLLYHHFGPHHLSHQLDIVAGPWSTSWGGGKVAHEQHRSANVSLFVIFCAGGVLLFSVLVSLLSAFPETNCVAPQCIVAWHGPAERTS